MRLLRNRLVDLWGRRGAVVSTCMRLLRNRLVDRGVGLRADEVAHSLVAACHEALNGARAAAEALAVQARLGPRAHPKDEAEPRGTIVGRACGACGDSVPVGTLCLWGLCACGACGDSVPGRADGNGLVVGHCSGHQPSCRTVQRGTRHDDNAVAVLAGSDPRPRDAVIHLKRRLAANERKQPAVLVLLAAAACIISHRAQECLLVRANQGPEVRALNAKKVAHVIHRRVRLELQTHLERMERRWAEVKDGLRRAVRPVHHPLCKAACLGLIRGEGLLRRKSSIAQQLPLRAAELDHGVTSLMKFPCNRGAQRPHARGGGRGR